MTRIIIIFSFLISFFIISPADATREDWSDLDEGEHGIYGSEKEQKYPINIFFIEKEDWTNHNAFHFFWFFKTVDYPKYESFRILPFYYNLKSKIDNREKTIVPLFLWYNRTDGDSKLLVTPLYYSDIKSNETDRSILYLFWWGNSGTDYLKTYKFFIPFLFYKSNGHSKDNSEINSYWINLLFYSESRTKENNNQHFNNRVNSSLLHFYQSDITPNENETIFWAPIIPLTYHYTSSKGGHKNFFWLLDYSWETDKSGDTLKRFWLAPFVFWKGGNDNYTHVLPPVFVSSRSSNGESYTHLAPVFLYKKSIDYKFDYKSYKYIQKYTTTSLSLLHYKSNEYSGEIKWDGDPERFTAWHPIIPLFYMHRDSEAETHRNLFWLFDWHINKNHQFTRLWFLPVWFQNFNTDKEYLHILPPLFISTESGNGEYYRHFLPLLYFSWNKIDQAAINTKEKDALKNYSDSMISLAFCSFNEYKQNESYSSKLWFPIVPLFYRSTHKDEGSHTNMLWLIDWANDKEGSLERFWLFPFVFHKTSESGYRYYFPFYLRPSGNTEENGKSFSLFHYHKWSPEERVMWLGPCYVQLESLTKEYFGLILPFYATWKSSKSKGEILLPWSITYEDAKRSVYVNIFGISKSAVLGPLNPEILVGAGTYKGKWYVDTDISWLYNVFRFSTRLSIDKPWGDKEEKNLNDTDIAQAFADDFQKSTPTLQKKKTTLTRENSEFFWGYKLLFGWFSYERGDSKRHIRLVPLWWFTWDKDSHDKLYTVPFAFLSYKSQELEYFVLFPFFIPIYGHQKEKESYAKGFLINAYWDEYDAEEKYREQTILWPLINWYSSPQKSGWRVFPLAWHKEYISEETRVSRNIILPLLYYSKYETDKKDNLQYKFVINPLYYSKYSADKSGISGTTMLPIIPVLYYSSLNKTFYSFQDNSTQNTTGIIKSITNESTFILSGLFFSKNKIISFGDCREEKESSWFLLGYYSSSTLKEEKSSLLFGLFSTKKDLAGNARETDLLYGLFSYSSGNQSKCYLIPFWYYFSSPLETHWNILLFTDSMRTKDYERLLIFPIWYSSAENGVSHKNILGLIDWKCGSNGGIERSFFLPLYMWRNNDESRLFIFPLLSYFKRSKQENTTFIAGAYYNTVEGKSSHLNILGLADWKYGSKGELERSWLLPLYLWLPGEDSDLFIFPMLSYFQRSKKESTTFIAGLYFYSSESYERQNLLCLFDHKRYNSYNSHSYRFLLGTIHYETDNNKTELDIAFGLFVNYKGYKKSENYEFNFLLFLSNWKRSGDYWISSVMPLWYYSENSKGWSFLSPIALSYFSKDKYGDLDLGLLGLLYLRYNNMPEKSDTRSLLLGTLYWERKKPERGYQSYGSFWGALWDYETESENDFTRFTILGGLFKRVKTNEDIKYTIFWII